MKKSITFREPLESFLKKKRVKTRFVAALVENYGDGVDIIIERINNGVTKGAKCFSRSFVFMYEGKGHEKQIDWYKLSREFNKIDR